MTTRIAPDAHKIGSLIYFLEGQKRIDSLFMAGIRQSLFLLLLVCGFANGPLFGSGDSFSLEQLETALKSPIAIERRIAVRRAARLGPPANALLLKALEKDKDRLVRRSALRLLCLQPDTSLVSILRIGLKDDDERVRLAAAEQLLSLPEEIPENAALYEVARRDPSEAVRHLLHDASWPFVGESRSVREQPQYQDNPLKLLKRLELPLEGWRFQIDPERKGHKKGWFKEKIEEDGWVAIQIAQTWEEQGHSFDGVAWYRLEFPLPTAPDDSSFVGVDLFFQGVDESAWVWINGSWVGSHDQGPRGWNLSFRMDATPFIKWGEVNTLCVRVLDRGGSGGIYKPVQLELLGK